jgi:NhaP-type Na+/H+ or K+/H+ antiporter
MSLLAILVGLLFGYSLVSRRLEGTILTGPMLFTATGVVMALAVPGELAIAFHSQIPLYLAEIGLVLLLFTAAGSIDLSMLWNARAFPARLLGIGLPLTIVLGTAIARLIFPNLSLWEAAVLSAILAPTDAGLGQVVLTSPRVPLRLRQALNVETGLNDGLAVPFMLFFIALAAASGGDAHASFLHFIVEQIGYGVTVGATVGLIGGWLLGAAAQRGWISSPFKRVGIVALAVLCLLVSDAIAASAFIAAFVAGLAVQVGYADAGTPRLEFGEIWGEVINLAVFFLFGTVVVRHWQSVDMPAVLYAVGSLTIVRMLPVALALIGTGLNRFSVLFVGWFGPRGLASIVLGLVYLEHEVHLPGEATIRAATIVTVLLSIFAHGLSAESGIALHAQKVKPLENDWRSVGMRR